MSYRRIANKLSLLVRGGASKRRERMSTVNLLLALLLCLGWVSCSEVKEVGEYDNWKERNLAFADSISDLTAGNKVTSASQADAMQIGKYYSIETAASTNKLNQYVYVKKLSANTDGLRPYYTDHAKMFYYGTLINGEKFDGNFKGYSALNRGTLDANTNLPTEFDSPNEFAISSVIAGWVTATQYMREGERWIFIVPYQSAYGTSGNSDVPGYSTLCFDIIMENVIRQ